MLIVGLTGSIGMGKSTTAEMFRAFGVPVHDSDRAVHDLYRGEAVPLVERAFPDAVDKGVVNRDRLSKIVLNNQAAMKQIERIIHPLVSKHREAFIDFWAARGAPIIVCDIPLLFETGADKAMDCILNVSAPENVQKSRALARPGMTEEKFNAILAKQLPDSEKRRRAHVTIETGRGFDAARRQIETLLRALASAGGRGHCKF